MTATAHSLVGASLGRLMPNPYLAIPMAILSNFLLDMVPHWDTGTGWHQRPRIFTFMASGIDVFLGLVLSFWLFNQNFNPLYLLTLVFAATLPDWLESPYLFLGWNFPPFSWFYRFQSRFHARDGTFGGILTQIIVVFPIVYLAKLV